MLAGIGSVMPAATTPIVTAVWSLPRSVRIAPPVILLPPISWNWRNAWFSANDAPGDADASADGSVEVTGELASGLVEPAAGVPVAPATPPLLHATSAKAATPTRAVTAARDIRDMVCPPLNVFGQSY